MPVKISTLLEGLAKKIGVPTDNPGFAEMQTASFEVSDEIAALFNVDLLTLEAARNHPKLKAHYYATSLNEVDRRLMDSMNELAFSETDKTEITTATSTFDRLSLYSKKIKELTAAKEGASGQEKTTLAAQINALQQQLSDAVSKARQAAESASTTHQQEMLDLLISNKIAGRKLDTSSFPAEVITAIARNYVDQAIQEKGIKPVYSNKNIVFKQSQSPELDYYFNNQPYTIDNLIDETLAAKKLIVVTDPRSGSDGQQRQQDQQQPAPIQSPKPGQSSQPAGPLSGMLAKLDRLEQDLNRSPAN